MEKRNLHLGLLFIVAMGLCLFTSFKLDVETKFTEEEMQEIYKEADTVVEAFVRKEKAKCRAELMEAVDARVDTMLMFNVRDYLREKGALVNDAPPRPEPPNKPEVLTPDDSTPLQPLIEDEEQVFQKQDTPVKKIE